MHQGFALKVNFAHDMLMKKSNHLATIIETLSRDARKLGLNDTAWAALAGVRNETVSRLRRRTSCDFATLQLLARAVGSELTTAKIDPLPVSSDGWFPAVLDRVYEEQLVDLCAADRPDSDLWLTLGPRFFMAGLAVMLASAPEFDRRRYLELGERLHAGSSQAGVFGLWLARTPLRPSRVLPMISTAKRRAA